MIGGRGPISDIYGGAVEALIGGDKNDVGNLVEAVLEKNIPMNEVFRQGLVVGVSIVGEIFKNDVMWPPE